MFKKVAPKLMAVVLLAMTVINLVNPLVVNAALSSQLGTQAALGSPLITQNFSTDDFHKWEPLVFGVFASNFVTPMVDDYKSAFATGQGGSEGYGRQALQFAGGNDSEANKALQSLLDYSISAQKPMKPIEVQYTVTRWPIAANFKIGEIATAGSVTTVPADGPRAGNINDMLLQFLKGDSASSNVSPEGIGDATDPKSPFLRSGNPDAVTCRVGDDTGGTAIANLKESWLPTLTIKSNDGNKDIVVFDYNDSWDLQVFAMWLSNVDNSKFRDLAVENVKGMSESGAPLYLDTFGNIVAQYNGRYIIVIPAAANQHITKNPTINLLNSVLMNGRYTSKGLAGLQESADSYGYSWIDQANGITVSGDTVHINGDPKGSLYLCFDTDGWLYPAVNQVALDAAATGKIDMSSYNFGKSLSELAKASTTRNSSSLNLKVNITGYHADYTMDWWFVGQKSADGFPALVQFSNIAAQILGNILPMQKNVTVIDYMHTNVAEKDPIFGAHGYINVSEKSGKKNMLGDILIDGVCKYMDGTASSVAGIVGLPSAQDLSTGLSSGSIAGDTLTGDKSATKLAVYLLSGKVATDIGSLTFGPLAQNAILGQSQMPVKIKDPPTLNKTRIDSLKSVFKEVETFGGFFDVDGLINGDTRVVNMVQRNQKVLFPNDNMRNAENILCVKEGTEFAMWTPWIYITYLEAYGIKGDTSNFNEDIFAPGMDMLNIDPEEMFSGVYMSDEEKQKSINEYTFLMLHPTAGREYRSNIILDWISDIVYNSYVSIVYGESAYNYSGGLGSTSSSGFLRFNNYEDNMLTGWFIQGYIQNAVMLVGVGVLAIIVVALIMRKRLSWMLLSIVLLVNIVLMLPSIGDLTPTLASNLVQEIFSKNTTFWAISESIANQTLEEQYISANGGITSSDVSAVKEYVRMLNTVNLDRTLMIRQDISKKVVENATGIMNVVQENASTRWLLPRLMAQFTAADGSKDYVFTTLGDLYDNWASLYWLYHPEDRMNAATINAASQGSGPKIDTMSTADKQTWYWADYLGTSSRELVENSNSLAANWFTTGTAGTAQYNGYSSPYIDASSELETWKSNSRGRPEQTTSEGKSHTQFYFIPGLTVTAKPQDESWATFAARWNQRESGTDVLAHSDEWNNALTLLQSEAATYSPRDVGARQSYGYLWITENPGTYFYQVVKETFAKDNTSFGALVGNIQGHYINSTLTGLETRVSSMHFSNSGDVKDVLDLEELFTNTIPYINTVQTIACGTDGTNGIFGDSKLTNYHIYNDNYASWLFRSNWVTKIMESTNISAPTQVRVNGTNYTISNPLDPRTYPGEAVGRPMIFSQAQKNAYGLADADLTTVELKCIKVNNAVERRWTMLLNYANTAGMKMEVMCRQMAMEALIAFNSEFSNTGIQTSTTKLYPTAVDLRYLSFDSVMKMLMINSSGNASYIYGDTMKGVVQNSDLISAILLLIGAFLCQIVIPLARDVILGLVFYLGLWSVICNIFAGGRAKLKTCAGYTISNAIYLVLTIGYYLVFGGLMQMSSADEVLSVSQITIDNGPPTFAFIIIIVVSIVYIMLSWKMLKFVLKNYKDLGFEVYAAWGSMMAGKISDSVDGLKDSFANRGSESNGGGGATAISIAGGVAAGAVAGAAGATIIANSAEDGEESSETQDSSLTQSGYSMGPEDEGGAGQGHRGDDFDIDRAVSRGRESRQQDQGVSQEKSAGPARVGGSGSASSDLGKDRD